MDLRIQEINEKEYFSPEELFISEIGYHNSKYFKDQIVLKEN